MPESNHGGGGSRVKKRGGKLARNYVVKVQYAPAGAGDREALAKARRHAFAAVLKLEAEKEWLRC